MTMESTNDESRLHASYKTEQIDGRRVCCGLFGSVLVSAVVLSLASSELDLLVTSLRASLSK